MQNKMQEFIKRAKAVNSSIDPSFFRLNNTSDKKRLNELLDNIPEIVVHDDPYNGTADP